MDCCCVSFYQSDLLRQLLPETFHPGGRQLSKILSQQLLIGPDDKVLEIACGRGETSLMLATDLGCQVVALDPGAENLQILKAQASKHPLRPDILPLQADGNRLPLASHSMDAVIIECAFCTFSDKQKLLVEIQRVLKPRSRFGFSDIVWRNDRQHHLFLQQSKAQSTTQMFFNNLCIDGALTELDYMTLLQNAGFSNIKTTSHDWAIKQFSAAITNQFSQLITDKNDSKKIVAELRHQLAITPQVEQQLAVLNKLINENAVGYLTVVGQTASDCN